MAELLANAPAVRDEHGAIIYYESYIQTSADVKL
jgi:hypothetical protein